MKSPIKWVGGKNKLVNTLLPLLPTTYKTYVEVFGGAGYLLFAKEKSNVEVLNDYDSNLINMFSVIKNHPNEFINSFKWSLVSRKTFDDYKRKYKTNDYKDEIEQAHIFYYLVQSGFGSDMKSPVFGTGSDSRNRLRLEEVVDNVRNAHNRLLKVTIENKSFEDIIRIYDSENTFFYLDPPYRNTKEYAVGKFTDEKYKLLSECCQNMKGKFLMTINDDLLIRELFKDFNIITHDVYYSVCKTNVGRKNFKELIITNYDVSEKKEKCSCE